MPDVSAAVLCSEVDPATMNGGIDGLDGADSADSASICEGPAFKSLKL